MIPQIVDFTIPSPTINDAPSKADVLRELDLPEYMLVGGGECLVNNI